MQSSYADEANLTSFRIPAHEETLLTFSPQPTKTQHAKTLGLWFT